MIKSPLFVEKLIQRSAKGTDDAHTHAQQGDNNSTAVHGVVQLALCAHCRLIVS